MIHCEQVGYDISKTPMAARRRDGFTLVELLVVVSIIALLISILLPSLKSAREQAKTLKCQAHVSGISKAAAGYQTEENDWIPGSPGTTGSILLGKYDSEPPEIEDMPEAPVQIWDFAGPLASGQMSMSSLPNNRAERFALVTQDMFECPANRIISEPYHGTIGEVGSFTNQKAVSYNTSRNLMMWPRSGTGSGPEAPFPQATFDQIGGPVNLPTSYAPRTERVGQPSEKIFVADGSRFTAGTRVTHNIDWDASAGGAFSDGGPTLPEEFLRSYMTRDPERRFSYRHPKSKQPGIVAAFFDGHGEWLSESKSRFPNYWWPKGTVIPWGEMNNATRLPLLEIIQGQSQYVWNVRR